MLRLIEKKSNRELLFSVTRKDLEIQTFRSGGPGGQHQNKIETGVRIVHRASGAVGESRNERSQHANKKLAMQRLAASEKFRLWIRLKAAEIMAQESIEKAVEKQMQPHNIKVEVKDASGRWVPENQSDPKERKDCEDN